jgi:hypothetical protein
MILQDPLFQELVNSLDRPAQDGGDRQGNFVFRSGAWHPITA